MEFHKNLKSKWLILITITLCLHGVRNDDFLTQFQAEIDQIPKDIDTLILHIEQNLNPQSDRLQQFNQ